MTRRTLVWQKVETFFRLYSKSILLLLFWQFTIKFVYNFTIFIIKAEESNVGILVKVVVAISFLCLAPVASFVADVKFGRFKTLVSSTYVIIISNCLLIVGMGGVFFAVHNLDYLFDIFATLIVTGLLASLCGMVFFLSNIIQFGTDQLRDAPTRYSVLFLYAIYWCDSVSNLLTVSVSLPGKSTIRQHLNILYVDKLKSSFVVTTCGCFVALSILVVFIVHKKKHWLLTEHLGGNPYLLTWRVVKFAAQHNKPIRRSAFTYCESDYPSRLDLGKKRYGGPFTTGQVEDVKTLLNILKVLLCLGPVFYLEQCTTHRHHENTHYSYSTDFWKERIFSGVISPALAVIFIPSLMKCFMSRCFPSMFKRMGFSIACFLLIFLVYIMYSIISTEDFMNSGNFLAHCKNNDTEESEYLISSSATSIMLLENVINFIYRLLLHISVWEFICCQSPQRMKGLLFGLLYAIQAFNQLLASFTIWTFDSFLKEDFDNCNTYFYLLNIGIAVLLLLIFTVVSYKYRYRKRDDICNIYQYAENYYSNYGTLN